MKRLLVWASAVAALVILVGAPAAYAANTLYVDASTGVDSGSCGAQDSPCQTIGQAIANASDGDTVQVAAGTYDESVAPGEAVDVDKSVTLDGAQAGNPGTADRASATDSTESVIANGNFDVEASDVTIDGFFFSYAGNQVCLACDSLQSLSDVFVQNNVLSGYQPNNFGPWQADDAIGVNHVTETVISNNYLTSPNADLGDSGGAAVQYFDGGCSSTFVSGNIFDAADQSALADIYFWCDSESSEATTDITVTGNEDINTGDSDFALFTHVGGGAQIDVTDNTVDMTSASSTAIYFSTDGNAGGVTAINIVSNTVTGSPFRAVKLTSGANIPGNITVTDNILSGNGVGFYADAGSLQGSATVTLRNNDLSNEGTEYPGADPEGGNGVYNNPGSGGTIDAIDNFWGCNGGPNELGCSNVTGDVTYDPWTTPTGVPTNSTAPSISGTVALGSPLAGSHGSWAPSPTGYLYQWLRCDSGGANCSIIAPGGSGTSYTPHVADEGHTLEFVVAARNANGIGVQAISAPTAVVPSVVPTNNTPPTISGTGALGQALIGTRGSWTGATTYTYQWYRCDGGGSNCAAITSGGNGLNYTVRAADFGHALALQVTGNNMNGSGAPAASPFFFVTPSNTSLPTATGTASVGQVLTGARGMWNGATTYAYQWMRCDLGGNNCTAVSPGATGINYTVRSADAGHTLELMVTAGNSAGSTSASSSPTGVVPGSAPANTGPPTITGSALVGQVLTGTRGTWTGAASYTYQWERCDTGGNNCVAITSGGAGLAYTVRAGDQGHTIVFAVTAKDTTNLSMTASSLATSVVPGGDPGNATPPTISGSGVVGSVLTGNRGTWTSSGPITYTYRWYRCDPENNCTAISPGATGINYTVRAADVGDTVELQVTATDSYGTITVTSSNQIAVTS